MKNQRTSPLVKGILNDQNPKISISAQGLACKRFSKNIPQMFIQSITGLSSLKFPQKLSVQILLLLALGILTP